jgi:serine/threonine protein kinase
MQRNAHESTIPEQIGPYTIQRVIARGGMGDVYEARNPQLRTVALKLTPHYRHLTDADIERFGREAEVMEALSQERPVNVVQFLDHGIHEDSLYIAMEYIDGFSLSEVMPSLSKNGTPNIRSILHYLRGILRGLSFVHKKGIVHRDIKPSNILVSHQGQVYLSDFGICGHGLLGAERNDQRLTMEGTTVGTPEYMAPEQCQGIPASSRSDIYSVGIVLYEMLTGSPPFHGQPPLGIVHRQVHDLVIPPGQKALAIPTKLEAICMRCLRKDPKERFADAQELLDAIESFAHELFQGDIQVGKKWYHKMESTWLSKLQFPEALTKWALLLFVALSFLVLGMALSKSQSGNALHWQDLEVSNATQSPVELPSSQQPLWVELDGRTLNARQPLLQFELPQKSLLMHLGFALQNKGSDEIDGAGIPSQIILENEQGNKRLLKPRSIDGMQDYALSEPLEGKQFKLYTSTPKPTDGVHKIAFVGLRAAALPLP